MKKKLALAAAGLVISAMALSACSGGSGSAGEASQAGGGAAAEETQAAGGEEAAASDDALHLTFYYPVNVGGSAAALIEQICADFNAENPDIVVEPVYTGNYDDTVTKIQTAMQGGTPPDVFVSLATQRFTMASTGMAMPLDDLIEKDSYDLSVYNGAAEQLQYNDTTYALPYRSDWYVLFYNKDLFDAAGVEYPSNDMTWEEYRELAAKMTSGEGSAKVYGSHHHTWEAMVSAWAVQDGKNTVVAKDYEFLRPYYEQALWLQDNGYIQDYATLKTANIHYSSVFKNQQCAMMPMGTYFIATMMQAIADGECDFNWGIATIPHPDDVEAGYTVGSITPIAISAYTDAQDLAWDFVKFAASEEAADILAQNGVFAGIQTEESLNTIASAENFPEGDSSKEALKYINFVFDRPLDPQIEEIRVPLDEVYEMVMIGEYTLDEGIAELNRRVAEIKGW